MTGVEIEGPHDQLTESGASNITPNDIEFIRPLPKLTVQNKTNRKIRRHGPAIILTSTPEKNKLMEKMSTEKKRNKGKKSGEDTYTTRARKQSTCRKEIIKDNCCSEKKVNNEQSILSGGNLTAESDLCPKICKNKDAKIGDYVLVKLVSVNTVKSFYYVGRVIDNEEALW